ncbi:MULTISPECIES: BglG family transcription antiterminator LicT [unclassified Granulicatella]|uniref:BglG family transcription antiterminator LicT n=1 Tax=unclassified Granulicatella TaxID=2630493 RepID=UPI001073BAFF|nr:MULTISPECIES: PRD domain-containing protein [unclassified Granulicatella]MBF0781097.1 PRD domain-containing protein [Granulicatella sp. 19428wC4_WM01]TFU92130.1 PRD domain-containing protein [Granulicatella sp. WM01]
MQIKKVFNNNIALVLNAQGKESIIMGKGIAFQKRQGDRVDESVIEKTFVLKNHDDVTTLSAVYHNLPSEQIDVVLAIIRHAEESLHQTFQSNLYITLADHIHFALERTKQGIVVKNPLSWEVKKFYPAEYQIGKWALNIIKEQLNLLLNEDEAASIALHLVNAEKDGHLLEKTVQITKLVQNIIDIVRFHYGIELNDSTISYNRFLTHIQYFAQRVVTGVVQGTNDSFLFEQVQVNYPQAFACTEKIKRYVAQKHHFGMGRDEQVYLTIHVQKLMNEH